MIGPSNIALSPNASCKYTKEVLAVSENPIGNMKELVEEHSGTVTPSKKIRHSKLAKPSRDRTNANLQLDKMMAA